MTNAILTLRGRAACARDFDPDRATGATFQMLNDAKQTSDAGLTTASAGVIKWINGCRRPPLSRANSPMSPAPTPEKVSSATLGDSEESGAIYAKTLSFFGCSRTCSIDFGQFAPMFRLDAARYRNAIS